MNTEDCKDCIHYMGDKKYCEKEYWVVYTAWAKHCTDYEAGR